MKIKILLICIIILSVASIQAQSYYNTDFTYSESSTNNLFKNATKVKDKFSSYNATLNLYPIHFVQFNIFSEYNYYGKNSNLTDIINTLSEYNGFDNNSDLTNFKYGGGFTLLPLSDSSAFSLFINMNYQEYSYKDALTTNSSEFSDKDVNGIFSLGYQLNEKTNIRSGFNYVLTGYASDSVTDKKSNEIFAGLNFSIFGSNAIDIEGGYTFEKYDYLPEYKVYENLGGLVSPYDISPGKGYSFLEEADLNSFYFSFRFSRPLGQKTGIALNYSFREFTDIKDSSIIYGYSTGYLSPAISSYEGNSIQAKIKTYLIPYTILNIGMGYWNSSYLKILETIEIINEFNEFENMTNTKNAEVREDDKYRIFASLSVPIVTSSGRLFEPSITLDYTDNESSIGNYTYSDFTATFSLNIK